MQTFVTGAAGFLGKQVVAQLAALGHCVRCLVRPSTDVASLLESLPAHLRNQVEIVYGDLCNLADCRRVVSGCDVIFHLAAEMRGATAVLFLTNVVGVRVLAKAAEEANVQRFVLIGSIAVHGTGQLAKGATIDENCPLDPQPHLRDPYTYSKVVQEQVCWEAFANDQLPLVVVRPGVIYGSGRDCLTGRVGLRLGSCLLVMNGRQRLPYTHVENCAAASVQAGFADNVRGQSFNIVDDDLPTGRELARLHRRRVGGVWPIFVPPLGVSLASRLNQWYHVWSRGQLPAVLSPYKSQAMWGSFRYSNAKAKAMLGWAPSISAVDGLEATLSWLRVARQQVKEIGS